MGLLTAFFTGIPALLAPLWLVGKSLLCIKFLLSGCPDKFPPTVLAD
jgi:hypothetical protein